MKAVTGSLDASSSEHIFQEREVCIFMYHACIGWKKAGSRVRGEVCSKEGLRKKPVIFGHICDLAVTVLTPTLNPNP